MPTPVAGMKAVKLFLLLVQPSHIVPLQISFTPHEIVRKCQSSDLKAMLTSYEISFSNYLTLHQFLLYEPYNFIRHYSTVRESPEKITALVELRHYKEFHDSLLHVSKLGSQPTLAEAIFKDDNLVYEGRVTGSHSPVALRFESDVVFKGIANAALLQIPSMTNLQRIAELAMLNDQENVEWLVDRLTSVMIPEFIAMFLSRNAHTNSGMPTKCDHFLEKGVLAPLDRKIRALVLICGMRIKNIDSVEYETVLQKAWLIVTAEEGDGRDFGIIFDALWTAGNERQDLQYWGLMAHMSSLVLSMTQDCSRLIQVVLKAIPDHLPPALSIPLLEKYLECRPVVQSKFAHFYLPPSLPPLPHIPLSHLPFVSQPLQVKLQHWIRKGPGMTGHLYKIPPGPLTIISLYKIVEQPYRQIPPLLRITLPLNLILDEPYLDRKGVMHSHFTDAILAAAEEIILSKSITPHCLSILMASWAMLLAEERRMNLSGILIPSDTSWKAWAKRITDRMNIGTTFVLNRLETWRISTNFTPTELLELVHKSDPY